MMPFSNPLSDCILPFGHDDLGDAVDPGAGADHLQCSHYARLLYGPQGADRLGLGQAQRTEQSSRPNCSYTGAVLEEREHSDFSCDAALIVEDIFRGDLPRLEALLEDCAFAAHFDRAFPALV